MNHSRKKSNFPWSIFTIFEIDIFVPWQYLSVSKVSKFQKQKAWHPFIPLSIKFLEDNVTLREKYKSYVTNGKATLKLIGNLIILMVCTLSGTFWTSKILFDIKKYVRFVMKANKSISSSIEIFYGM